MNLSALQARRVELMTAAEAAETRKQTKLILAEVAALDYSIRNLTAPSSRSGSIWQRLS